jgi:hypothetical protein
VIVEGRAKFPNSAGRFNRSEKTDPAHGIEDSTLDQVHVVAGNGYGRTSLAPEALFDKVAERVFSF